MRDQPNIIFILTDDLGYRDLGCYGQEVLSTPNIDRMAEEGMRFTQCYTGSPLCAPSRSVFVTGQHAGHTRVRDNFAAVGGVPPQGRVPLEPEDTTVAEVLKFANYRTGIAGKWGLGEPETTGVPNRKGFDQWLGYLNQRNAHSYYPPYLWRNQDKMELPANEGDGQGQWSHELIAEFGLEFIRTNHDRPFFLYLPWTLPHGKYQIPDLGEYADKDWTDDEKGYAAMVSRIDSDVGDILDLLKELDIDDRTIVFFCSDNGAARRWERFGSCGNLRGCKGDVYEGGIRTPMVVRWPGRVPAGEVSTATWYFADFLPTVAELAGAEVPHEVDGVSVLPTLLGEEQEGLEERYLYWELPKKDALHQAARRGDFKAVRHGLEGDVELYELDVDEGESTDVAREHRDVAQGFADFMTAAHEESPCWPDDGGEERP
jgi:arylsulfatase A-like enzyme